MSDVEITVGANNQGLSSGLASAQSQLNSFGKSFDSAFGLDSENKIKRNLGGLVTDLSRANSLMDVLAISANRLENVFKSMASIGISFAVGLAMKSALEGAAKEADNLLGAMQKTASFSASGKTVADLERQKELVAAQADRLKEAGLLTRLLYSDGLAAAAKLAETEQKLLDIAIEKRKQAELTAALSAQDKRMGDRFEAKAFKALTKYETDDSKLFKMVSDANAKIAAAENEFNASSDVERRAELIKEIEKAEAQILAIQGRRNELQREVDQAAKSAADQAAAKEREIVAEEKKKEDLTNKIFEIRKRIAFEAMSEKEQVEALTKEMEDLRKSSSLEDQARAAELELELQRRGSSPAAMVSAPRLDSLAQLGGGIAGVNYDAILNTAKPVEEKQLATQERIAESSDQIARTVSRFGIAEI